MRQNAAAEDALLRRAIDAYAAGFSRDPANYYPGINAITLLQLLRHLTGEEYLQEEMPAMEGAIRWAAYAAMERDRNDYWPRATWGDCEVLSGQQTAIERAYRDAVVVADRNWFKLDSTRQQLSILQDLGFRPIEVDAGLQILVRALERLEPPEHWEPNRVFLFSGHMIDAPDRPTPRFPPDKEPIAASAIGTKLDELGAAEGDLAISGAACGGDLLFGEATLQRGLHLQIQLPVREPDFLDESVNFAGGLWPQRYSAVKQHANTAVLVMPDRLGPCPEGVSHHERNNVWMLYNALVWGADKVHFLCLWNRQGGDGPGGTKHMIDSISRRAGQVHILDTTTLWQ
jgi:hypothetical protein